MPTENITSRTEHREVHIKRVPLDNIQKFITGNPAFEILDRRPGGILDEMSGDKFLPGLYEKQLPRIAKVEDAKSPTGYRELPIDHHRIVAAAEHQKREEAAGREWVPYALDVTDQYADGNKQYLTRSQYRKIVNNSELTHAEFLHDRMVMHFLRDWPEIPMTVLAALSLLSFSELQDIPLKRLKKGLQAQRRMMVEATPEQRDSLIDGITEIAHDMRDREKPMAYSDIAHPAFDVLVKKLDKEELDKQIGGFFVIPSVHQKLLQENEVKDERKKRLTILIKKTMLEPRSVQDTRALFQTLTDKDFAYTDAVLVLSSKEGSLNTRYRKHKKSLQPVKNTTKAPTKKSVPEKSEPVSPPVAVVPSEAPTKPAAGEKASTIFSENSAVTPPSVEPAAQEPLTKLPVVASPFLSEQTVHGASKASELLKKYGENNSLSIVALLNQFSENDNPAVPILISSFDKALGEAAGLGIDTKLFYENIGGSLTELKIKLANLRKIIDEKQQRSSQSEIPESIALGKPSEEVVVFPPKEEDPTGSLTVSDIEAFQERVFSEEDVSDPEIREALGTLREMIDMLLESGSSGSGVDKDVSSEVLAASAARWDERRKLYDPSKDCDKDWFSGLFTTKHPTLSDRDRHKVTFMVEGIIKNTEIGVPSLRRNQLEVVNGEPLLDAIDGHMSERFARLANETHTGKETPEIQYIALMYAKRALLVDGAPSAAVDAITEKVNAIAEKNIKFDPNKVLLEFLLCMDYTSTQYKAMTQFARGLVVGTHSAREFIVTNLLHKEHPWRKPSTHGMSATQDEAAREDTQRVYDTLDKVYRSTIFNKE